MPKYELKSKQNLAQFMVNYMISVVTDNSKYDNKIGRGIETIEKSHRDTEKHIGQLCNTQSPICPLITEQPLIFRLLQCPLKGLPIGTKM